MSNTSATGGPLLPNPSPAPLEGQALLDLLQDVVAGVTGLAKNLVRVGWQPEPPNPPDAGTAWAAVRVSRGDPDVSASIIHDSSGDGADLFQRHEELNLLCSFYDLGVDGQADYYADLLRDGIYLSQNREALQANLMDVGYTGLPVIAPVLVKQRWQYRVDVPVVLRRQTKRSYPVLNLLSGAVHLVAEDAARVVVDETISVTPP